MDKKEIRKGYLRAKLVYSLGATIALIPFCLKQNFHCTPRFIKEDTFILLANHAHNYDAVFAVLTTGRHMRFVISDHLIRNPVIRHAFAFLASPIINHREKGTDALYDEIVASCRQGISVGMFPEGGKTDNGETMYISPRNARLVKDCDCALVTCRIIGGYLKAPRWADSKRRGPVFARIAGIYGKNEIAGMSEEELYSVIKSDLYVNAYDEQRNNPHRYIGKNPAQNAEIILYACPECNSIGTLTTKGSSIFCSCGFRAETDEFGFWHGKALPFDNITAWDNFQKSLLEKICNEKRGTDKLLFSDGEQTVYRLINGNRELLTDNADLLLYGNRMEIRENGKITAIPIDKILRISTAAKTKILLITTEDYYEIHSLKIRSGTKYKVAVRFLQGKKNS